MLSTILFAMIFQATQRDYLTDVVTELKKEWPANRMIDGRPAHP